VSRGFVPPATATELRRLRPGRIVILGGSGVVSGAVASSLGAFSPSVTRLSGADRYATAAAVSKAAFPAGAPIAYLATGTGFADALAASPVAHRAGGPLLLTTPGSLAPAVATELARLRASRVVIVGGTGAISSTVETSLRGRGLIVTRVSGADRYATAAALSRGFPTGTSTYLASGTGFPDALAGGVAAARSGQPMLLTSATSLPGATTAELDRLAPPWITVLGGTGAVSAAVAAAAASAAR
jgi:putative cell wall-binding protein